MREIKFRAWDANNKKMIFGPTDDNPQPGWVLTCAQSWPLPLMQFTGLKDKNGREIYEGDVLAFYDGYKPNKVCVRDVFKFYEEKNGRGWHGDAIEIIGNIHENPGILEGK